MTTTPAPSMMDRLLKRGDGKPLATPEAAQGEAELLEIAALAPEAALGKLKTGDKGLSADAVEERREQFGPNAVAGARKLGMLAEIYQRTKNPLVIQLLVIALVSLAMHDVPSFVEIGRAH